MEYGWIILWGAVTMQFVNHTKLQCVCVSAANAIGKQETSAYQDILRASVIVHRPKFITLDVEHRVLQVPVDAIPPQPHRVLVRLLLQRLPVRRRAGPRSLRRTVVPRVDQHVQVLAPALARDVGVVRCGHEADRLRRARIQVARGVRALLDCVRVELVLVVDDHIVGRLDVALQPIVRLGCTLLSTHAQAELE